MAHRFFRHSADASGKGKDNQQEERGLSDFLTESQRGDLMVLISLSLEHMRKTITANFEALPVLKAQTPRKENQDTNDHLSSKAERDLLPKDIKEQEATGLNHNSRAAALTSFDDWQNSVLLRVGQVVNEREKSHQGQVSLSTNDHKSAQDTSTESEVTLGQLQKVYRPVDTPLCDGPKAQRLLILRSLLLLLLGLEHYNAYSRVLLLHITSSLKLTLGDLNDNEAKVARTLLDAAVAMTADEEAKHKAAQNKTLRNWKVGVATVAGAALIGITGGLAAPLVAAGLGTVMGGLGLGGTIAASYLGALASSGVVVGGLFGAYGGKMTGQMMDRYAKEVEDFAFIPVRGTAKNFKDEKEAAKEDHRLRVTVGITGWVIEEDNIVVPWRVIGPESEVFALRWEYEALLHLGNSMRALVTTAAWKVASHQVLIRTVFAGLMSAVMLPFGLVRLAKIAANPFNVAISRADKAGEVLADALINGAQGKRPVTLIGYSLGARVIYSCLQSLAKRRAYGLIESAIFMGSPIPADSVEWYPMRAVVAGRLVNVYSENDSVLALLYRATHLEVDISGLQPVEGVPNLENVDVSATISGHLRYQFLVGQILSDIGFEEIDAAQLAKEKAALSAQDQALEREREENEQRKRPQQKQRSQSESSGDGGIEQQQHTRPQTEKSRPEESDEEEELNRINLIDEEDEARLHQEVEQRTHEQMMNRKMERMRFDEPHVGKP